jgi:hypothetical protein
MKVEGAVRFLHSVWFTASLNSAMWNSLMSVLNRLIASLFIALVACAELQAQTGMPPPAAPAEVQRAIERGLFFIERQSMVWWNENKCFACHEGAMLLFSHNVAKRQGIPIDQAKLNFWTDRWWFTGALSKVRDKDRADVGGKLSLPFNLLFRDLDRERSPRDAMAFEEILLQASQWQDRDGGWGAVTPWMALGLASIEQSKLRLEPAVRRDVSAMRQLTEEWILTWRPDPPQKTEDLAGWVVYEHQRGERTRAKLMLDELLGRQRSDGGWGMTRESDTHLLVTGAALFALKSIGISNEHPAIVRTQRLLLDRQQDDGRWREKGRVFHLDKYYDSTDAWTSGIVAAALTLMLPELPPGVPRQYTPDSTLQDPGPTHQISRSLARVAGSSG